MKKEQVLAEFKQNDIFLAQLTARLSGVFKNLDKVVSASRTPINQEPFNFDPSRCVFVQFNKNNPYNRNKQPHFKKNIEQQQPQVVQQQQQQVNANTNQAFTQVTPKPYKTNQQYSKINYSVFYNNDLVMQNKALNVSPTEQIFYYALQKKNVTMIEGPINLQELNDLLKCGKYSQELPIGVRKEDQMTPANVLFTEDIKIYKQEKWNQKRKMQEEQQNQLIEQQEAAKKQQEEKEQEEKRQEELLKEQKEKEEREEKERLEKIAQKEREEAEAKAKKKVNPLLDNQEEVQVKKQSIKVEEQFFITKVENKKNKNKKATNQVQKKKEEKEIVPSEKVINSTENTWDIQQPIIKEQKKIVKKEEYPDLNQKEQKEQKQQQKVEDKVEEKVEEKVQESQQKKEEVVIDGFMEVKSKKQKKKQNNKKTTEDQELKKLGIVNSKEQKGKKMKDEYPSL